MLIRIPALLSEPQLAVMREKLYTANWQDGRNSAGYLAAGVKHNAQLADLDPAARELGVIILDALEQNPLFTSAALPHKIVPPMFNRYQEMHDYGHHIDGAIRPISGTPHRVRTDLSATVFISGPDEYDGGELQIEDTFGSRSVKLAAGDMVLYPGTSVHRVTPVTRGTRLASFFWIQSMVRNQEHRNILFQLDRSIQNIAREHPGHAELVELAGIYHNLLREWADT